MTGRLPALSARQVVAALERGGFYEDHQSGSHKRFKHRSKPHLRVTVPMHSGSLKRGTLMSILRQADLSTDEFRQLL